MALLGASPQVRTQRVYSTTHLRFFGSDPSSTHIQNSLTLGRISTC